MSKVKIIMNPNADMGNAWRKASDLRAVAEEYGGADWAGTVYPTHATELAKKAAEDGYDLVIAAGGDGTTHEVMNGLMEVPADKRPALGVVPMGSGNDYSHILNMPEDPEQALKTILTGKRKKIDIGTIEDEHGRHRYWDNTCNIGFGGLVNIYSHDLPIVRGFLMYFIAVIITIIKHNEPLEVTFKSDEGEWEEGAMLIAACNGPREGGGFATAPHADPWDGTFDLTVVKNVSRLQMLMLLPKFMSGTQGTSKDVYFKTFKELEIKSKQPLYLHTDGENYAGFVNDVHYLKFKILPQALEVIVPADTQ